MEQMEQMATQLGGRREMEERAYKKGSAKPSMPGRHGSSAVEKEMADEVRTLSCKSKESFTFMPLQKFVVTCIALKSSETSIMCHGVNFF